MTSEDTRPITSYFPTLERTQVLVRFDTNHRLTGTGTHLYAICSEWDLKQAHIILYHKEPDPDDDGYNSSRWYVWRPYRHLLKDIPREVWSDSQEIETAKRIFPQHIGPKPTFS